MALKDNVGNIIRKYGEPCRLYQVAGVTYDPNSSGAITGTQSSIVITAVVYDYTDAEIDTTTIKKGDVKFIFQLPDAVRVSVDDRLEQLDLSLRYRVVSIKSYRASREQIAYEVQGRKG